MEVELEVSKQNWGVISITALYLFGCLACGEVGVSTRMSILSNSGISEAQRDEKGSRGNISSDVATLIAKGLIAGAGFDLNLYRVESFLDQNAWKINFILKDRYRHFNVRCATVYVNKGSGEIDGHNYFDCSSPPVLGHATKSLRSSLPDGSIGIRIDRSPAPIYLEKNITPEEWECLFWDELGATDPNYAADWRAVFTASISQYPKLSRILGEYGSRVTFERDDIEGLADESLPIARSGKNPVAVDVVKRILTACELARKENSSLSFVAD